MNCKSSFEYSILKLFSVYDGFPLICTHFRLLYLIHGESSLNLASNRTNLLLQDFIAYFQAAPKNTLKIARYDEEKIAKNNCQLAANTMDLVRKKLNWQHCCLAAQLKQLDFKKKSLNSQHSSLSLLLFCTLFLR